MSSSLFSAILYLMSNGLSVRGKKTYALVLIMYNIPGVVEHEIRVEHQTWIKASTYGSEYIWNIVTI